MSWESSAHAQGWLGDRKYAEGIGIKAGDLELHPGLGGEVGFDSNWFKRTSVEGPNIVNGAPQAPVVAGGIFRITPSLYIKTLGAERKEGDVAAEPPKVDFRAGLSATYRAFLGGSEIVDQNGAKNISADLDAAVIILPKKPFSVGINARYNRLINPNATGNPDASFNRNNLGAGIDVTWTPGGGTLDWKLGYMGQLQLLDTPTLSPFDNVSHNIFTRGNWRFRPKTAFIYDGSFAFNSYTMADKAFNALTDSTPLRSKLGISGLISPRFSLLAMVGYGGSFMNTTANPQLQQYNSVIGQLEAKFFLTANPGADAPSAATLSISSISIGYNRDFAGSFLGTYYGSDRGYAKFAYFFGGRAIVALEGGVGALEYPNIFKNGDPNPISAPFTNIGVDASLFGEYRFSNTLGLNTTLRYTQEISSTQLPAGGVPAGALYDMNYHRFEAYLGFRWFM